MRIGELARRTGISADTVRYYERQGLLPTPPRGSNRYRDYDASAEETLRFIRKAQASGLKLADVRDILEIIDGGRPPCDHVRAVVTDRLAEVRERQRELSTLQGTLEATLARLASVTADESCRCAAIDAAPHPADTA